MLTQKYRSESDLVIWLLFGFEEVIVQVTDRECPLEHMRTIGVALAWLACLYGVIFNTSLYFFVIVISLMDPSGSCIIQNFVLMRALVEEGSTLFLILIFIPYILIEM